VIAIDTSALIAILIGEKAGGLCLDALARDTEPIMSAVSLVECRIVARKHGVLEDLSDLLARIPIEIIGADRDTADRVAAIQIQWGKGNHRAQLNILDCFSYDIAKQFRCPLLYIGNDFSQTDISSALA
jgi:ribonuclease VapC